MASAAGMAGGSSSGSYGAEGATPGAGMEGYDMSGMSSNPNTGMNGPPGMEGYPGTYRDPGMEEMGSMAGMAGMAGMPGYGGTGTEGYPGTAGTEGYPAGYPGAAGTEGYPGGYPGTEGTAGVAGYPGSYGTEGAAGYGGAYPGAGGNVAQGPPETLDGKAWWAFARGRDRDAMQYLFAYALTSDAGASEILPAIRWAPGLRRPALAVRMGVGFNVTGLPPSYTGDIKPIGTTQNIPKPGARRGGGESGGAGYDGGAVAGGYSGADMAGMYGAEGGGAGQGKNAVLERNAGELGEKLLAAYRERLENGDFGQVLKDALAGGPVKPAAGAAGGVAAAGTAASDDPRSMMTAKDREFVYGEKVEVVDDSISANMQRQAGGAAAGAATTSSYPGGAYPGGAGAYPGGDTGSMDMYGRGAAGGAAGGANANQLAPGLTLLGLGDQRALIDKAKKDELDVLLFFDVKLRANQVAQLITNETTITLIDVRTSKRLGATKKLSNIEVQKDREAGKDDGVDKEVAGLFELIDKDFKLVDLPAQLNAEVATKRVGGLIAEKHDNPLPVLVEIRMYHTKGLLDDAKLSAAYERMLGVDLGRMLATGVEEDKIKVLERYLPKEEA